MSEEQRQEWSKKKREYGTHLEGKIGEEHPKYRRQISEETRASMAEARRNYWRLKKEREEKEKEKEELRDLP